MSESRSLFENFEVRGKWWFPKISSCKASGKLSFNSEQGVMLEIERGDDNFGSDTDSTVILGTDKSNTEYTLYRIHNFGDGYFGSKYLFIGDHFGTEDILVFASIRMRFNHLEEWLGDNPISKEHLRNPLFSPADNSDGHEIIIRYKEPSYNQK